jgi:hypothetical protein
MNFKVSLGGVMTLFISILIVCYLIAKQANPVFLDEHGRPSNVAKGNY